MFNFRNAKNVNKNTVMCSFFPMSVSRKKFKNLLRRRDKKEIKKRFGLFLGPII